MTAVREELATLLAQIVTLKDNDAESFDGADEDFSAIKMFITMFSNFSTEEQEQSERFNSCLAEYVHEQLVTRNIDVRETEDNFENLDPELWYELFELSNKHCYREIGIAFTLILSLLQASFVNRQKLARARDIKVFLWNYIEHERNESIRQIASEIFVQMLSVHCEASDFIRCVISPVEKEMYRLKILHSLAVLLRDQRYHSFFSLENYWLHIPLEERRGEVTLLAWISLNSLTSNRLLSIDGRLHLEIRESKLCLSNDDCVLGVFESYEFFTDILYCVSFVIGTESISFLVDGVPVDTLFISSLTLRAHNSVTIGSGICSFKIFKLWLWTEVLPEPVIRFFSAGGLYHTRKWSSRSPSDAILENCGDHLVGEISSINELSGTSLSAFRSELQSLSYDSLVIDWVPPFVACESKDIGSDSTIDLYKSGEQIGKCYCFKSADFTAAIASGNIVERLLDNMIDISDISQLHFLTEILFSLLEFPSIEHEFEKKYSFSTLAYLFKAQTLQLKTSLSIQFLLLFLQYCGFSVASSKSPILKHVNAFKNLILNFDLWRSDFLPDPSSDEIETMRFVLFQIIELMTTSEHNVYNSRLMQRHDILGNLLSQQHSAYSGNVSNFVYSLNEELIELYGTLVCESRSSKSIYSLLRFSLYEIENFNLQSALIALRASRLALQKFVAMKDITITEKLIGAVSIKVIVMIMESTESPDALLISLELLLSMLHLNVEGRENFVRSNGYSLLYEFFMNFKVSDFPSVISLLWMYSLGPDISNRDDLTLLTFFEQRFLCVEKIALLENHYLIVDLIEWAVINDIKGRSREDVSQSTNLYLDIIASWQSTTPSCTLFDPRKSSYLIKLLELYVTLTKPQNCHTYSIASQKVSELLASCVIEGMMSLAPQQFAEFLESIVKPKQSGYTNLRPSSPSRVSGYIEMVFWLSAFPSIVERLYGFIPTFEFLFDQNANMFSNFIHLLQKTADCCEADAANGPLLLKAHKCVVSACETIVSLSSIDVKRAERLKVQKLENRLVFENCMVFRATNSSASEDLLKEFLESLMFHQEILFSRASSFQLLTRSSVATILTVLVHRANYHDPSNASLILNCFRVISLHRVDALEEISTATEKKAREKFVQNMATLITLSDEELSSLITQEGCHTIFEKYLNSSCPQGEERNKIGESERKKGTLAKLATLRNQQMENRAMRIQKLRQAFRKDSLTLYQKHISAEETKILNDIADREDQSTSVLEKLLALRTIVAGRKWVQERSGEEPLWMLDSSENINRMRRRLLPKYLIPTFVQPERPLCGLGEGGIVPSNSVSHNNSQMRRSSIMSFEIVHEFNGHDTYRPAPHNRNRKILKLLKNDDSINHIWNCSHVIGLRVNEGILIKGEKYVYHIRNYFFCSDSNKIIELADVSQAMRDGAVSLINQPDHHESGNIHQHEMLCWEMSKLAFVTKRPFLLRDFALELIFEHGENCFFTFHSASLRNEVYREMSHDCRAFGIDPLLESSFREIDLRSHDIGIKNGLLSSSLSSKFVNVFYNLQDAQSSFDALKKWQNGQISNFFYLMIVNTLAGRTFNDLTQYPVFPWVIADYDSEVLDLEDPNTFRDLSKPMGAQSEKRMNQFVERYEMLSMLNQSDSPPFHYGTHYSSAMIVSSYLMRLEPFVSSFLLLQDGKFGHADRLFNSIGRTWRSAAVENSTDVRELMPEFFYLPDFLTNKNHYDMGVLQSGDAAGDVVLPPWAKNDPKIFVQKNREALESPYVSKSLHLWIDLIFGYKQKYKEAEEAVNVFNKLSYPGNINLDDIDDENEKKAITGIIYNFGQTPLQVFSSPHPSKNEIRAQQNLFAAWCEVASRPTSHIEATLPILRDKTREPLRVSLNLIKALPWRPCFPKLWEEDISVRGPSLSIGGKVFSGLHETKVTALVVNEFEILTADKIGAIKLWSLDSTGGEYELKEVKTFYGHLFRVTQVFRLAEYSVIVSLDSNGTLLAWDTVSGDIIRRFAEEVRYAAPSSVTANVAVINLQNELTIFDINGNAYVNVSLGEDAATSVAFGEVYDAGGNIDRHRYEAVKDEFVLVGFASGDLAMYRLRADTGIGFSADRIHTLHLNTKNTITSIKAVARELSVTGSGSVTYECAVAAGSEEGSINCWTSK
ncbi:LAMI_0G07778g1_1 [Lachancea mirantina]|uniref:Beige protein homolog 1 n=1 Tax=Lachancea mirantina TaxID=1230905 RepID=A0A1G4K9M2_9SACH|nr:LAMI_0G07778g1_1 [Lachancea mirantina]